MQISSRIKYVETQCELKNLCLFDLEKKILAWAFHPLSPSITAKSCLTRPIMHAAWAISSGKRNVAAFAMKQSSRQIIELH